jgi:hypothetical protein
MKQAIYLLIMFLLAAGCSKAKNIEFCMGVSPKGEGIKCGTKFEDGDLTAVIKGNEPFGVKSLTVQVFESKNDKTEKIETLSFDVLPEMESASVNLSFYSGGKYIVRAFKNDVRIAEGEIVIVER